MHKVKIGYGSMANQCPTCGAQFPGLFAFDKHRIGKFGVDRRCMTQAEMLAKGMHEGRDGKWRTAGREAVE